jgi:hypothetical protein
MRIDERAFSKQMLAAFYGGSPSPIELLIGRCILEAVEHPKARWNVLRLYVLENPQLDAVDAIRPRVLAGQLQPNPSFVPTDDRWELYFAYSEDDARAVTVEIFEPDDPWAPPWVRKFDVVHVAKVPMGVWDAVPRKELALDALNIGPAR